MSKIDISISIVSYNTGDLLVRCIKSIQKYSRGLTIEIIVVDNYSSDNSVELVMKNFPDVRLIANKTNKMFAGANNQALATAKGKYFLILNPDTYFVDNSLKKLIEYFTLHQEVGAIDGLEIYEDGKNIPSGSKFSSPLTDFYELSLLGKWIRKLALFDDHAKKIINNYRLVNKDRKKNFEIDVACDAYLFTTTEIMKTVNGYDESFMLYYTENDLCLRIKKLGYKIMHVGDAKVVHTVSASVKKIGWRKLDIYYHDLQIYYRKHGYILSGSILFYLLKLEETVLRILRPNMMNM